MENQSHTWVVEAMDANREYLRRFLIGISRDVHLSEDLLQETYLNARAGAPSYRGGDVRSWLCAIARNCFYAHTRRKSFTSEEPLAEDYAADAPEPGSTSHVDLISVKQAVATLPDPQRQALLMKHYGGFTYKEIADHLRCPVGTAKQRVWSAITRLRRKLCITREDVAVMSCDGVAGTRLLEYVCGGLSEDDRAEVEAHMDECAACRLELATLSDLFSALDSATGDFKSTSVVELDESGGPTLYNWCRVTMPADSEPIDTFFWESDEDVEQLLAMAQGNVVEPRLIRCEEGRKLYAADLERTIKPGDVTDVLLVARTPSDRLKAHKLDGGTWRYEYIHTPNGETEWVHVSALRLPSGAEFVSADPEPAEVKRNSGITLVWSGLLPKVSMEDFSRGVFQFKSVVDYKLP